MWLVAGYKSIKNNLCVFKSGVYIFFGWQKLKRGKKGTLFNKNKNFIYYLYRLTCQLLNSVPPKPGDKVQINRDIPRRLTWSYCQMNVFPISHPLQRSTTNTHKQAPGVMLCLFSCYFPDTNMQSAIIAAISQRSQAMNHPTLKCSSVFGDCMFSSAGIIPRQNWSWMAPLCLNV